MKSIVSTMICLCCLCACKDNKGIVVHATDNAARDTVPAFTMPAVPAMLTSPESRAAYLAEHFWDGMDFRNHALSLDTAFMEQNFANYLSVFPAMATRKEKDTAVAALLHKAAQDSTALAYLQDVVEKYLHEPNSPMRDEETLIIFYEQLVRLPQLTEGDRERTAWRLKAVMRNRPGSLAEDFSYRGRDGASHTLHGTGNGRYVLLLFYDPECGHCGETTSVLAADGMLAQMQEEGLLTVLAIDAESDADIWQRTRDSLPQSWTVGLDYTDTIKDGGLYDLPAMPVIFLLDRNKRVILKDTTADMLIRTLAEAIR